MYDMYDTIIIHNRSTTHPALSLDSWSHFSSDSRRRRSTSASRGALASQLGKFMSSPIKPSMLTSQNGDFTNKTCDFTGRNWD